MFFTQEDYRKIEKWLLANSRKDTDFVGAATPLKGNEIIVLVQNGKNVKASVKDVVEQLFLLGVSDFVNITDKYNESYISLSQAIELIPYRSRKVGQVVTFLDDTGKWSMYQFQGLRKNQWNTLSLWVDLIDLMKGMTVVDSEDIVTEVNSANQVSLKFANKTYNEADFSGLGRVYLRKNIVDVEDPVTGNIITMNLLTQSMISKENTIYVIQYDYNLNKQTITIPSGCVLLFEGGSISNGTLSGNKTYIETKSPCLNVNLAGSFVGDINANWFYLKYDIASDQSELIEFIINQAQFSTTNTVRFGRGTLWIDATRNIDPEYYYTEHGCIEIPSNVNIDFGETILKVIPNNSHAYNILSLINVENVNIIGGTFVGDVINHTYTSGTHEWGYGIALFGSRNISIRDCTCEYCTGDGINIQVTETIPIGDNYDNHCKNITIDNVRCWYNRRQGISIEGCIECRVNNCDIQYTGSIKGTAPMAGIDVEPKNMVNLVKECTISNSTIINNKGHNIMSKMTNDDADNFSIENLYIVGCDVSREGGSASLGISGKNVQIDSCKIKRFTIYKGVGVSVAASVLEDIVVNHWTSSLAINSCKINVTEYLITIYTSAVSYLNISDCVINLGAGSSLYRVFNYNNNIATIKLINNYIFNSTGNITINAQTIQLINNIFSGKETRILTPIRPSIVGGKYYINIGTIADTKSILLQINKQSGYNSYIPITIKSVGYYTLQQQTTPLEYNLTLGNNLIKMNGCSSPILVENDYTAPAFCIGNLKVTNTLNGSMEIFNPLSGSWTGEFYVEVDRITDIQFSLIDKSEDITASVPVDLYRTKIAGAPNDGLGNLSGMVTGSIMKDIPMDILKYKMSENWRNSDGTLVTKVIIV